MEKKLRSALQASPKEFLSAAVSETASKQIKSTLKTLIWSISPSSTLCSSLPSALHLSISQSLDSFKNSLQSDSSGGGYATPSPCSPPSKRPRRSSFRRKRSPSESKDRGGTKPDNWAVTLVQLRNLRIYACVAHLCVCHPKKCFSTSDLLPSVRSLHDCLVLYEMDPLLLSQVSSLCEEWWKEKLPGRETLISQSLPFLLSRSLAQNKKADVHRVYALREAFALFDFMDESIEDLRLLLVRCVITPLYLKTEEGRRFVASMLGLNGQLLKEALALIRSQIPFGRKSVLEAYSDILFRAWKCSEGSLREELEDGFLQGLIEGAIHASSRPLATSIRRVLGGFIDQRVTEGVDKLLFRLAEPVLFRSLQVANSNVRQNALHLLIDMFPLEDPDVTREVKNALLDKQFFLLEKLLVDDSPDVRVVAVEGSCRILHLFWEVIPSPTITKILTKIVDDMSHDMCNEVRLSTLNGIIFLLDNPQTYEILKVLLPRLGCMFLDPVLSVRLAVSDLLLAVRDIRSFQFNKVVGLDTLLSSLANDHPLVAQKVTRLLIPSYFPSKVTLKEACSRCITLIKRSPTAGARFCEFALLEGLSSKSLVELVRVFCSFALSSKDLNPDQIDGLYIASANLCCSLLSETSSKAALIKFFSREKLKCLLTAATSLHAQNSVLSIVSIIPPDDLADFREHCLRLIMNCGGLSENLEMQAAVHTAHKLMFSHGWFDDMFGVLANILQMAASGFLVKFGLEIPEQDALSTKKKKFKLPKKTSMKLNHANGKGSSRLGKSTPEEDYVVAAAAAWQMKYLLTYTETRNAVLKSSILELVFSALRIISQVSIEQCVHWEFLDMSPVLAYTSLSTYMSLQNVDSTFKEDLGGNNNNGLHSTRSTLEQTTLVRSLNHLLNCTEICFYGTDRDISSNSPSKLKQVEKSVQHRRSKCKLEDSSSPTEGAELKAIHEAKRISNVVQIATTILKFIVDAATMRLVPLNEPRWLCFASTYARHVISAFRKHQNHNMPFEDLKKTFACLKSSFSYAANLLHLVISSSVESSPTLWEISYLANDLLDLITSIELYLGSRYAAHIISVAKPWLPDLILGLGTSQLTNATQVGNCLATDNHKKLTFPVWLVLLGKLEFYEVKKLSPDRQSDESPEPEVSVFKKLMEMLVEQLKRGNRKILEAVGIVFLTFLKTGLETEDFDLVLGLMHFLCVKLVGKEYSAWNELEIMHSSMQESYIWIESAITALRVEDDGRQKLESAKELLKSVGINHV